MEIRFEQPRVPNFVKTNKGLFDIADLSEEELTDFMEYWGECLMDNYNKRKCNKTSKNANEVEEAP